MERLYQRTAARAWPDEGTAETCPAFERLSYLCPSRYFHFYLFYERQRDRTCWLPEGYVQ